MHLLGKVGVVGEEKRWAFPGWSFGSIHAELGLAGLQVLESATAGQMHVGVRTEPWGSGHSLVQGDGHVVPLHRPMAIRTGSMFYKHRLE